MTQAFRNACTVSAFELMMSGGPSSLAESYPFFPMSTHGMPPAGPDFVRQATAMANDEKPKEFWLNYLYFRALYDDEFSLGLQYKASVISKPFILGGLWAANADGPRLAETMVVGKMPGQEELRQRCNMSGPSGEETQRALRQIGYADWGDWYMANLIRHEHCNPRGDNRIDQKWIKNCLPILWQEFMLVRPKYLLLFGAEAVKHVLGKEHSLTNTQGRVSELCVQVPGPDGEPSTHTIQVMTSIHPAFVIRRPENTDNLVQSIRGFVTMVNGGEVDNPEVDIDHRSVYKIEDLRKCRQEVLSDSTNNIIAIDAEWHGEFPSEDGAFIRSVQFSWKAKKAAAVVLHDTEGKYCFDAPLKEVVAELSLICNSTPERKVRIAGHYLNADMPWLISIGLDVMGEYFVPIDDPGADGVDRLFGWQKTEEYGGFDTLLAAHAVNETAEFKLETLAVRHTTCPRYDHRLQKWKKEYCSDKEIDAEQLDGYGPCPDDILIGTVDESRVVDWGVAIKDSYGAYDADATRRLVDVFNGTSDKIGLLDNDANHQVSRVSFWTSMWSCPAFGEMHIKGLGVDMARADELVNLYRECYRKLLAKIRRDAIWPEFNPNSIYHCRELLFSEDYNGAYDRITWTPRSVRPVGATSLGLSPYKSTGKRAKLWVDIRKRNEENLYSPSCDKEVLQVLADQHPLVSLLRDLRVIGQVLKYVLRPRTEVKTKEMVERTAQRVVSQEGGEDVFGTVSYLEEVEKIEEGEYERGMLSYVHKDQSIRSHFSQTKETARASSWGPPLQNLGKSAEEKFRAIFKRYKDDLGLEYKCPLRSIIGSRIKPHPVTGEPCQWVMVDSDWTGAELALMAWQSGDENMTEHVRRANLDEKDPNFYDIHSNVAVNTFRLKVPETQLFGKDAEKWKVKDGTWIADVLKSKPGDPLPATKKGLSIIGKSGLRTAAKAVVFGYAYGQQAESTYRKARQEGVEDITLVQAQALIDGLVEMYPCLPIYFEECRTRSQDPGYLVNCFYRMRRFMRSTDKQTVGEQERQAMNYPIQSGVADAMNTAMGFLYWYRYEVDDPTLWYDIVLQVHDAAVLECPAYCLDWVVNDVIPTCMSNRVPVYRVGLDGSAKPGGPWRLQVPPPDVFTRWSSPLTKEECEKLGINEKYAAA